MLNVPVKRMRFQAVRTPLFPSALPCWRHTFYTYPESPALRIMTISRHVRMQHILKLNVVSSGLNFVEGASA